MPIDVSRLDSFDPFSVPTISQLCQEFELNTGEDKPQKLRKVDLALWYLVSTISQL